MLLPVSSLLLVLHSLSGVIAAPAKDNVDLTYDRDGEYDAHPVKSTKAKISVDNDFKIPGETQPNYHILAADTSVTQLGVDPVVCNADGDDADDDDDDDEASNEKRSVFHQLFARALTSDQTEALKLHNDARKKVKVSALKWDTKLEAEALAYAKKIAKAGKMKHSEGKDRPGQGENLAYAWASNGFKNPITAGTKGWLNEKKNYKGETIPKGNFSTYGHYTQAVWNKSTKIGIATAKDKKGAWYTVARYTAAGNVVGKKPY
ncbi:hypothetical protein NW768_008245 [Fusarium equiseti]|uniref:SCP domain-containing protein n=1 Tax=Fusarium equiseti TaxID=61235 RepID=A0ABQ8R6R7_FUSEQ|nr:hypothetical protein NW768_008245 [Fusarium equiseti]